ncbi:MAG: hypothetical protein IT288_07955 [Bdellovibrionales bacterium]|nr:hypothetical protein [Bdellovibrionales bacterium]
MAAASAIAEFQKLFEATTKADAQRLASQLVLDARQFGDLITIANGLGFTHELVTKQWAPDFAARVPAIMDQIVAGSKSEDPKVKKKGAAGFNLINQLFIQRKLLFSHFFVRDIEWHVFYFSGEDYFGAHFDHPHVHYASHLWNHDLATVKAELQKKDFRFSTTHLQVIPFSD